MSSKTIETAVQQGVTSARVGNLQAVVSSMSESGFSLSTRHVSRLVDKVFGGPGIREFGEIRDRNGDPLNSLVLKALSEHAQKKRLRLFFALVKRVGQQDLLVINDRRGSRYWAEISSKDPFPVSSALHTLKATVGKDLVLLPHGDAHPLLASATLPIGVTLADYAHPALPYTPKSEVSESRPKYRHLNQLEDESLRIIRETIAVANNPGMLFSMGKDSMVMWALAKKAFWPEPPPFPLIVIDTRWKFQDMYQFREYMAGLPETELIVHINPDAIREDINPFDQGSAKHTEITKTIALKQVLDIYRFDFVFGGARRDEERSRAKERIFSIRDEKHSWNPKTQRPELWNLYNTVLRKGESMRVFPLSNWTELDVWRYIEKENIPVVPLYFSKVRPFVEREGSLIMVDDERFRIEDGEKIHFEAIRFRTLGCYPLTGGMRSGAGSVAEIIQELEQSRVSERSSRVIDFDAGASMEQKKKDGYF